MIIDIHLDNRIVCKEYSLPVSRTTQNYFTRLEQTMYAGSVKSPGSTAHKKLGMRYQSL